jgi:hypothetical protein
MAANIAPEFCRIASFIRASNPAGSAGALSVAEITSFSGENMWKICHFLDRYHYHSLFFDILMSS